MGNLLCAGVNSFTGTCRCRLGCGGAQQYGVRKGVSVRHGDRGGVDRDGIVMLGGILGK